MSSLFRVEMLHSNYWTSAYAVLVLCFLQHLFMFVLLVVFSYFKLVFVKEFTGTLNTVDFTWSLERSCSVDFNFVIASRLNFSKQSAWIQWWTVTELQFWTFTSMSQCSVLPSTEGKTSCILCFTVKCHVWWMQNKKRRVGREYWNRVSFTVFFVIAVIITQLSR